jgi:glyoxylase-like metal-dependent hydrolase (beta-lactamase superfamily II)
MLIANVLADAFETKCYLLATDRGADCVIVDPGFRVAERLGPALDRLGLRPRAVLLTHGHLDHTYSVTEVCRTYRIPVYLHPGDHWMLSDPFAGLGCEFGPQFERILEPRWRWHEPDDVRPLRGGDVLELAGLRLGVDHTPGHTPGSVMFNLPGDAAAHSYLLVGDVLYAGSIGRTDMPGGSRAQTLMSLKGVLAKADETVLLTGHGENSTVARERTGNIFMRQAAEWDGTGPVPQTPRRQSSSS